MTSIFSANVYGRKSDSMKFSAADGERPATSSTRSVVSQSCLIEEVTVLRSVLLDQITIAPQLREMASSRVLRSVLESYQAIVHGHFMVFERECGNLDLHDTRSNGLMRDVVQKATWTVREQLLVLSHPHSRDTAILAAMEKISIYAVSCCEVAFVHACATSDERMLRLLSQIRHDELVFQRQWFLLMQQFSNDET